MTKFSIPLPNSVLNQSLTSSGHFLISIQRYRAKPDDEIQLLYQILFWTNFLTPSDHFLISAQRCRTRLNDEIFNSFTKFYFERFFNHSDHFLISIQRYRARPNDEIFNSFAKFCLTEPGQMTKFSIPLPILFLTNFLTPSGHFSLWNLRGF